MKYKHFLLSGLGLLMTEALLTSTINAAESTDTQSSSSYSPMPQQNPRFSASPRIGVVSTKKCLEQSKAGKQAQADFAKMKEKMESVLAKLESDLEEIETNLADDDWVDSASEETLNAIRYKRKTLRAEGMQLQNQYMQTLQQTNIKIVDKLTVLMGKASEIVAKRGFQGEQIDIIFTDDACTFVQPKLYLTDPIVEEMDSLYEAESKTSSGKSLL